MAHAADPRTMLALARDVFGHCPEAWWLTIPAVKLGFGEELSPVARRGYETALEKIRRSRRVVEDPCGKKGTLFAKRWLAFAH